MSRGALSRNFASYFRRDQTRADALPTRSKDWVTGGYKNYVSTTNVNIHDVRVDDPGLRTDQDGAKEFSNCHGDTELSIYRNTVSRNHETWTGTCSKNMYFSSCSSDNDCQDVDKDWGTCIEYESPTIVYDGTPSSIAHIENAPPNK